MQKAKDITFGSLSESQVLPILREFFKEDLQHIQEKYSVMDFESEKSFFELKSRNVKSSAYKDTMVGMNKIKFAKESTKPCYFCFKFQDGLFYWKYEADKENEFRTSLGGRSDRGRLEVKEYAYIFSKHLIKIC